MTSYEKFDTIITELKILKEVDVMGVKEYLVSLIQIAEQEIQVAREYEGLYHQKAEEEKHDTAKQCMHIERDKWTATAKEREQALLRYQCILDKLEKEEKQVTV